MYIKEPFSELSVHITAIRSVLISLTKTIIISVCQQTFFTRQRQDVDELEKDQRYWNFDEMYVNETGDVRQ